MSINKIFLMLAVCIFFINNGNMSTSDEDSMALSTVESVDIERYLGEWYEIASFPQWFQRGCSNTIAMYSLRADGNITVQNRCIENGREKIAEGLVRVPNEEDTAKFEVSFFGPFWGKYWIIDLDSDYKYAVVGHPSRRYLWILSRTPTLDSQLYQDILTRLRQEKGYNLAALQITKHN